MEQPFNTIIIGNSSYPYGSTYEFKLSPLKIEEDVAEIRDGYHDHILTGSFNGLNYPDHYKTKSFKWPLGPVSNGVVLDRYPLKPNDMRGTSFKIPFINKYITFDDHVHRKVLSGEVGIATRDGRIFTDKHSRDYEKYVIDILNMSDKIEDIFTNPIYNEWFKHCQ